MVVAMSSTDSFFFRSTVVGAALALVAVGCGSSDDAADQPEDPAAATDAPAADDAVGDDAAPDVAVAEAPAADDDAAPDEAPASPPVEATPDVAATGADEGSGEVVLTLNDGRSWSFTSTACRFDPGATGPAAAVFDIAGSNDDGLDIGLIEAWPLDGNTDTGTAFIATFVDETDELYIFVDGSAEMVGNDLQVSADFYNNAFYEEGDAPDGSAVVTCNL